MPVACPLIAAGRHARLQRPRMPVSMPKVRQKTSLREDHSQRLPLLPSASILYHMERERRQKTSLREDHIQRLPLLPSASILYHMERERRSL